MKQNQKKAQQPKLRKSRETRAMLASRFRVLCADAGLSIEGVAKLLHVTSRTVRYWFSGKCGVPYAAYKLVRVLRWFELPQLGFENWCMHSGKLWTPEGHGISPQDGGWWSLLVRQARCFREAYGENHQLRTELARAWKEGYLVPDWETAAARAGDASAPILAAAEMVHRRGARKRSGGPRSAGGGGALKGSATVADGAGIGLVTSINNADTQRGIGVSLRYHIDHGLISCPTRSDFLHTSIPQLVSGPQGSASASTPSFASASMPTSTGFSLPGEAPSQLLGSRSPNRSLSGGHMPFLESGGHLVRSTRTGTQKTAGSALMAHAPMTISAMLQTSWTPSQCSERSPQPDNGGVLQSGTGATQVRSLDLAGVAS
jgi:DNA-binding transcriptional regulator YiaG